MKFRLEAGDRNQPEKERSWSDGAMEEFLDKNGMGILIPTFIGNIDIIPLILYMFFLQNKAVHPGCTASNKLINYSKLFRFQFHRIR